MFTYPFITCTKRLISCATFMPENLGRTLNAWECTCIETACLISMPSMWFTDCNLWNTFCRISVRPGVPSVLQARRRLSACTTTDTTLLCCRTSDSSAVFQSSRGGGGGDADAGRLSSACDRWWWRAGCSKAVASCQKKRQCYCQTDIQWNGKCFT